ncbi:MAG: hypothetical protein HUU46_21935 [Candidatus Hydrogenedentes bacterium]|nr:hypothetical protein [Candidatus Hydrogenedentota bacterium]
MSFFGKRLSVISATLLISIVYGCSGGDTTGPSPVDSGTPVPPPLSPVAAPKPVEPGAAAPAPAEPVATPAPAPTATTAPAALFPLLAPEEFGKEKNGAPQDWWVSAPARVSVADEKAAGDAPAWVIAPDAKEDTRLVRTIYANVGGERLEVKGLVKSAEAGVVTVAIAGKSEGREIFASTTNKGGDAWEEFRVTTDLPKVIDKDSLAVRVGLKPGAKSPALLSAIAINHGAVPAAVAPPAASTPVAKPAAAASSQRFEEVPSVLLAKAEFDSEKDGAPQDWWVSDKKLVKKSKSKGPGDSVAWTISSGKSDDTRMVRTIFTDLSGQKIEAKANVKASEAEAVTLAILCKADGKEFYQAAMNSGGDDWAELSVSARLPENIEKESLSIRIVVKPGLKKPVEVAGAEVHRIEKVPAASLSPIFKREEFANEKDGLPQDWWASDKGKVKAGGANGPCGGKAWQLSPDGDATTQIARTIYTDLSGKRVEFVAHVKSSEAGAVVISVNGKSKSGDIYAAARNKGTGTWERLRVVQDLPEGIEENSLSGRITVQSGVKTAALVSCVEFNTGPAGGQ